MDIYPEKSLIFPLHVPTAFLLQHKEKAGDVFLSKKGKWMEMEST